MGDLQLLLAPEASNLDEGLAGRYASISKAGLSLTGHPKTLFQAHPPRCGVRFGGLSLAVRVRISSLCEMTRPISSSF